MNCRKALVTSLIVLLVSASGCGGSPTPSQPVAELIPTVTSEPLHTAEPTAPPALAGPVLGDTWTRPADGMVMVYVPAGEFEMGSTDAEIDLMLAWCNELQGNCQRSWFEYEQPRHTVALGGFWIDRTEVTNAQYARCVAAGACTPPTYNFLTLNGGPYHSNSAYADYPVTWVTWDHAVAYARWVGGRLPTEAEWEYAARGPEGRIFPWGDLFDGTRLNYCDVNCDPSSADRTVNDGYAETAPVGSYPGGASWVGALDMAGNVWEWVADRYEPYSAERQENPTGPTTAGADPRVRGGAFFSQGWLARTAFRPGGPGGLPSHVTSFRGFRVVVDSISP